MLGRSTSWGRRLTDRGVGGDRAELRVERHVGRLAFREADLDRAVVLRGRGGRARRVTLRKVNTPLTRESRRRRLRVELRVNLRVVLVLA